MARDQLCSDVIAPRAAGRKWRFAPRFRKNAFGWNASRVAVDRIADAVAEIKNVARTDPIVAAHGAVTLIGRFSPALEQVDSSSGAVGSAVNRAIVELVPVIAGAPAQEATRRRWLDALWDAVCADLMPYIERVGDHWGDLCVMPQIAGEWAERLKPAVLDSFLERGHGGGYFRGTPACFSALMTAQAYDEVLALLERNRLPWWEYRRWGFRALLAQGKRAEALRYAEASRGSSSNDDVPIALACEAILLESGMHEEAYRRYALVASAHAATNVGRFRALTKKYPSKPAASILRNLIATTPGEEGKWFASAKSAGLFEEAIELARSTPCDPKTLTRAARDFKEKRPDFARDAALVALHWFAEGYGFEVTSADVLAAYLHGREAAASLNEADEFAARATAIAVNGGPFVRASLRAHLST